MLICDRDLEQRTQNLEKLNKDEVFQLNSDFNTTTMEINPH